MFSRSSRPPSAARSGSSGKNRRRRPRRGSRPRPCGLQRWRHRQRSARRVPVQHAYTKGRPVKSFQAAPDQSSETQPAVVRKQRRVADEQRGVGAPDHPLQVWPVVDERGAMSKYRAAITRVRATDVRELVSSAIVPTRSMGTFVKRATDATGPPMLRRSPAQSCTCSPRNTRSTESGPGRSRRVQQPGAHAGQVVAHRKAAVCASSPTTSGRALRYDTAPMRTIAIRRDAGKARRARQARKRRQGCCGGSLRAGRAASLPATSSFGETLSTSSAPNVSATCASFGP